ncbi:MAG: sn-glycerol-3-phosphate ABC transporter ATP-binding protein UgpC [Treponema sp.]|jgi:multiple sugar transport system ATP-binding protein|nr:sn-glycerol-3-phosphate ABC transporter ATP-binding protein UgpC [Treponema sp.]
MANVSLKNVKKIYHGRKDVAAVSDFNLDIEHREFVVFVGPSGCGKSTTLRMIAGLEEITEGKIYIDDRLVNMVAPKDRDIAMVFQNYALYPHMSVFDNMAFSLKLRKLPKSQIKESVENAARILDISELLGRKPKELSGGQRQRVAIGRAIVRNPKVFLMDEPLSNLDAKLRNQMRAELIQLRNSIDTTFIYVTHDQTEAMTLGDRIVIMKDGYIHQVGTPNDVFYKPKNVFVGGFIGTPQMNFINNCRLEIVDGQYYIKLLNIEHIIGANKQEQFKESKIQAADVIVGIRPQNFSLSFVPSANSFEATITVTELLGSEMFVHVNANGKPLIIRITGTETINELIDVTHKKIENNESIAAYIAPDFRHLHIFDSETENNLLA